MPLTANSPSKQREASSRFWHRCYEKEHTRTNNNISTVTVKGNVYLLRASKGKEYIIDRSSPILLPIQKLLVYHYIIFWNPSRALCFCCLYFLFQIFELNNHNLKSNQPTQSNNYLIGLIRSRVPQFLFP